MGKIAILGFYIKYKKFDKSFFWDDLQISLLILSEFKRIN